MPARRHSESEGARQYTLLERGYHPARVVHALAERMPKAVWRAVVKMRKAGHTVYRRDTGHAVDGRRVETRELLEMARSCPTSTS